MIDLHYWTTPNGHKITMFLEETGLQYKIFPVNIGKGDQFKPEFLAIAPNNRIPAMLDHEPKGGGKPISIFESGAMLLYLAEKTGKFLPADLYGRYDAIQWTFWQMGGLGPMAGQNHHFRNYAVGKNQIRHRPLRERDQPALRRAQQAPRRSRVRRRRLFDRRHGELSLGRALQEPGPEHRRLPAFEALAGNDPGAARDRARLCPGERGQSEFRPARDPHRGRAQAAVRADRGGGEIDRAGATDAFRHARAWPAYPCSRMSD